MRMLHYILDEDDNPVGIDRLDPDYHDRMVEAEMGMMDGDRRTIAKTFRNGVQVSTVFLTTDHAYGDGPPVLWESMVFGGKHDQAMERRYTSREDAIQGHLEMVREVLEISSCWDGAISKSVLSRNERMMERHTFRGSCWSDGSEVSFAFVTETVW